jgi:hypothetical protein
MGVSGTGIRVDGLTEIVAGLKASKGGLRDLRAVHQRISDHAGNRVHRDMRATFVRGWHGAKAGGEHAPAGYLLNKMVAKGSANGATVKVTDGGYGYLMVQERGGTSYWHGGGKGALRSANRGQDAVNKLGGGYIGTGKVAVKGHIIYKKPVSKRGYFIWNVAWREREYIGREYYRGVAEVFEKHGIKVDMATDTALIITPEDI